MKIYLREIRTRKNISIRKLAKKSGVSKATISNIEGGMVDPKVVTISKLCNALGVEINEMVDIRN